MGRIRPPDGPGERADLACGFAVRVAHGARATLTDRERQYVLVSSEPYLFVSDGYARLDGIEHVGAGAGPRIPVAAGPHAVTVHLVSWDDEPGMAGDDGRPAPGALPDFVVLIDPAATGMAYRQELLTFEPYGA